MDFNIVVRFYERLQETSSRLEMIDIVAELLAWYKDAPYMEDELQYLIYFTRGQLNSAISSAPTLGLAEKMLIEVLKDVTYQSQEKIREKVIETGDIGDAAALLLESREKTGGGSLMSFVQGGGTKKPEKKSMTTRTMTRPPRQLSKKDKQTKNEGSLTSYLSPKEDGKQEESKESDTTQDTITLTEDLTQISVKDVFEELMKIAKISGHNAQREKKRLLTRLIGKCNPTAVKYLFKIMTGTLRTGASLMTIIDGLAVAYTGTRDNRAQIERAYNIHPDLGQIALLLRDNGLAGLETIKITVGIPIRMMLASRGHYSEIPEKLGIPFISEEKYDGERVQVHKDGEDIILYSRQLKDITAMYPDVVELVKSQISVAQIIFEGEIVAIDKFFEEVLPFQVVSQRRRKYKVEEMIKEVPIRVYGFELLYLNRTAEPNKGENVLDLPIEQRRHLLQEVVTEHDQFKLSQLRELSTVEEMVEFFKESIDNGMEGLLNKKMGPESVYTPGNRGELWIKLKSLEEGKLADSIDVLVIGAYHGSGKRTGYLSTLLGAIYNPKTDQFEALTKIGSGFSEEDLEKITKLLLPLELEEKPKDYASNLRPDLWVRPHLVIEINGDELTLSPNAVACVSENNGKGISLRFPRFQRIREDKGIKDVTTSQEILQLYKSQ